MLSVLLPSCATRTEYIYCVEPVDTSVFPDFPAPVDADGKIIISFDADTDTISFPRWYYLAITDFKIDYDATLKRLDSKYDSK